MSTTITDRLALIIDAHSDGAVSAVKRLSLEETAAAERAEVLQAKLADLNTRIARSASGASAAQRLQLSKLNAEYSTLTSGLAKVPAGAAKAEAALAKVGLGGIVPSSTLGALGKAAPGLAAGAAVFGGFEFIKHGIDSFEELATQIRSVAQAASTTAPEASRIVEITNALGLSSDQTALGLFRLGKNIELTPEKLATYNIAIARTKTGNVDLVGTLFNVADAYQHTTDPAKRAALVFQAFGRAGTTMLPILNANRKQLEEIAAQAQKHGLLFSSQDLQNARDLQVATHEMKDSLNALSITAARALVPILTTLADVSTKVADFAHGPGGTIVKDAAKAAGTTLFPFTIPVHFLHHGGGVSAKAKAEAEIQNEQTAAAQKALSDAALGTLAGGFDVLAGTQKVTDAKQSLRAAQEALIKARAERVKAERELATAKDGKSGATVSSVAAAEARVAAAEANLRKANYIGGDQRIATANAGLLSAQDHLNKLRAQGGTDTGKLADATERLREANVKLANAQKTAHAAQKAVNQSTGLSAKDVLARIKGQANDQGKLAGANVKLAAAGLSTEVIGGIDKLNQEIPGTLAKVAKGINAGIVAQLNAEQDTLDAAQQEYADAASNPSLFFASGVKAGDKWSKGFAAGADATGFLNGLGFPTAAPSPAYRKGRAQAYAGDTRPGGLTVQGDLIVKADDPKTLARRAAEEARYRALSGLPSGASL